MKKSNTSERLQEIMKVKNLKQVDILERVKQTGGYISKSALSQYVNGFSEPDQQKLTMLSKALGVSETWLMGYDTKSVDNGDLNPRTVILAREAGTLTEEQIEFVEGLIKQFKDKNRIE